MLIGHQNIFRRIEADAKAHRLHHAHLFLGPEQLGKTKTALALAVLLQGSSEESDAQKILIKRQILGGLDPDTLLFLDAGESLPIETIRSMLERLGQGHHSPYLIVILENMARLRPEATNALLKTLEEPHPGTVFFLTAHREEDVLPTIRSRVQTHFFHSVPEEEMLNLIEEHPLKDRLLFFALGRPGKLIRLRDDPAYLDAHESLFRDLSGAIENPRSSLIFALVRKYEGSELLPELLDILIRRVRGWLLSHSKPQALAHLDLIDVLERTENAKLALRNNVNSKLLLENLLLTFVP